MTTGTSPSTPDSRVREFMNRYSGEHICAAELLCDRHDPQALAYTIVNGNLEAREYSYGDLREASERFAAALKSLGIQPGDRVATLMGKSWQYLVALMGIWRVGAVHVPLFTAFAPPAIALRLLGSNARAIICDATQERKLRPGDDIPADAGWKIITTGTASNGLLNFDELLSAQQPGLAAVRGHGETPLIQIYTSGTTGNPKGVIVPVRALAAFHAYAEFGLDIRAEDVYWCAADPGWAYGLYYGVIATFLSGARSILFEEGFSAEKTATILQQHKVTNFSAAPTIYRSLRAAGLSLSPDKLALRCVSSAGEPLTPEINDWAEQTLGVTVRDHYGQTETGMLINNHQHPAVRLPVKPGSMGQALPGWKGVVLDTEEDREAPPNQMGRIAMDLQASPLAWFTGYDGNPEKSAERFLGDGRYYVTGDTGAVDDEGYFYFSARDDDVIIMAGYRIGPFEVESVLLKHPAVAEAAIIAVPDEVKGEVIEAYIVPQAGTEGSDELAADLKQWVKTHYAAHAYPRTVHFIDALPKTPSGKVQRFALRKK